MGNAEAVAGLELEAVDFYAAFQQEDVYAVAGEGGGISERLAGAEDGEGETGVLVDPESVVFCAGANDDLPLVLTAFGVEGSLVVAGSYIRLFGEDPYLEEVDGVVV